MQKQLLPWLVGFASHIAPRTIGDWAAHQFQMPRRRISAQGRLHDADETFHGEHCSFRRWGAHEQPQALLVHGWEGHHSQLHSLGNALLEGGYSVTLVDPPAHGDAGGKRASPQHFANAIREAADKVGAVEILIGHSMGGLAAALAIQQGLAASQLVMISAPSGVESTIETVADWLRLSSPARRRMLHSIEAFAGLPVSALDSRTTLANYRGDLLVAHDREDRRIPVDHALKIKHSHANARLYLTSGLGHTRLLQDPVLNAEILGFANGNRADRRGDKSRG